MPGWKRTLRESAGGAVLALCLALHGVPAVAVTLEDAMVTTYLTSSRLESGRDQLRQTDELVPQALSGYRPNLFLNGSVEAVQGTVNTDSTGVISNNRSGKATTVQLRQNIYAGGGTQAAVSRAEHQVTAERARLLGLEQQVLLDAVDAYTAVYRDQEVLALALNNEQRLQRQLEATRDRFQVGEVARTDVAQAEARLARARADVETAKADLAASRALYRRVVGEEPRSLVQPLTLHALPSSSEEAEALAANSPDVLAATFALYAARDDVDVNFSTLLPSVDLQAEAGYADQPTATTSWSRSAAVGVNVSIPLYQGGADYSRVRQSRQLVRQRRSELETTHRSVQEVVSASWERLLAATAAIEAFKSEVRANRIALEGVQQEALVGSRTVLDVLDAQQELFTSQVNLVRAQREEVVASYQLKLAVGQLTVSQLNLAVQPFDSQTYYNRQRTRLFGLD
ncbi:MAG: TolC family outer membrane protein [Geminicoccaceae bacterium]